MKGKTRVLLADDHLVVRMGLSAIVDMEKDMAVVGEVGDGLEAVRLVEELRPDVVVMDLMMPLLGGAEATERILKADASVRILVLTSFGSSDELRKALANGAIGALVKDCTHEELIAAIRAAARGERHISPVIERQLMSALPEITLTERQREVLVYVAKGFSNTDIARLVGIGRDGVKAHLKTIFERLNVASRSEAVALAVQKRLISV